LPFAFGIITSRTGTGAKRPRLQLVPDVGQERRHPNPRGDRGDRSPIHPRGSCTFIPGDAFPRVHQERRITDEVEQITEQTIRIFDRPAAQLDLHPSYRQRRRIEIRPVDGAGIHRRIFDHCSPLLD